MAITNVSTLDGIMETLVPDAGAIFATTSKLLTAVDYVSAGTANTVQFNTRSVPSAVSAHTEGATVTPTATTLTAVDATLSEWTHVASVSKLSIGNPRTAVSVAQDIGGALAATIDTEICKLFDDFTTISGNDTSSTLTIADFWYAKAQLDATGYTGRMVAVFDPISWNYIAQGLAGYSAGPQKAEEFVNNGVVANIGGVDIYVSSNVQTASDGTNDYAINWLGFDHAIGVGYRDPLIDIEPSWTPITGTYDFAGTSLFKAVVVTAGAGVMLNGKIRLS